MGGALGVAVIGSLVASVYAGGIDDVAASFGLTGSSAEAARSSLGGALSEAATLGPSGAGFADAAKDAFVSGLSQGLRVAAVIVAIAAVGAYRFLPARAHDPLTLDAVDGERADGAVGDLAPVAGS
jgi:hypothetical protein